MTSKILMVVSVVIILLGLLGVRMQAIGKRLAFLWISSIGIIMLSVAEDNAYGVMGGLLQIPYRMIGLLFLTWIFHLIGKKNAITKIGDMSGIGRLMPYTFAELVVFSLIIIGIPATGTFTGILYSELGLLAGDYGVVTYIGMLGNVLGMIVPAVLILPVLRVIYFPEKRSERADDIDKPGNVFSWISFAAAILLIIFCIFQKPVLTMIGNLLEKILG